MKDLHQDLKDKTMRGNCKSKFVELEPEMEKIKSLHLISNDVELRTRIEYNEILNFLLKSLRELEESALTAIE